MRILVVSDTHIPAAQDCLPSIIEEEAKKSDMCIHAGDFINWQTYQKLAECTKVHAVCGNMDSDEIAEKLPLKDIIKVGDLKIGIIHGCGAPANLVSYIDSEFSDSLNSLSMVIYGHSHFASDKEINKRVYFNPGSPTDRIFAPYCSYGIIEIDGGKIKRKVVKIG